MHRLWGRLGMHLTAVSIKTTSTIALWQQWQLVPTPIKQQLMNVCTHELHRSSAMQCNAVWSCCCFLLFHARGRLFPLMHPTLGHPGDSDTVNFTHFQCFAPHLRRGQHDASPDHEYVTHESDHRHKTVPSLPHRGRRESYFRY